MKELVLHTVSERLSLHWDKAVPIPAISRVICMIKGSLDGFAGS